MILGSTLIVGGTDLIEAPDGDGMSHGIHRITDGTILGIMVTEDGTVHGIRRGMADIMDGDILMTIIGDGADTPDMLGEAFTESTVDIPAHWDITIALTIGIIILLLPDSLQALRSGVGVMMQTGMNNGQPTNVVT